MKVLKTAVKAAAAAGIGLAAVNTVKNKKFCPVCFAKKTLSSVRLRTDDGTLYSSGVALTPPMGWSSWNTFRNVITEDLILDTAKAIKQTGLLDAGYEYINLDDCWQSSMRTPDGRMQGDLTRFPSGIKSLAGRVNALGMKLGIYSSNGTLTCEDLPASLGNEALDADTFAEWGIEYLKYDFCHNKVIPSSAPLIDKLYIGRPGGKDDIILEAEKGELSGQARVIADEKVASGSYVGGLCAGNGKLTFRNVNIDEAGEYVLTVGIRKSVTINKFFTVTVNGTDEYEAFAPPTTAFTPDGRIQLLVKFNEGANTIEITNPIGSRFESSARQYTRMGLEVKRAAREYAEKNGTQLKPICYSICEWGFNMPWKWGAHAGNLWRTTMDIKPHWASVMYIYEINVLLYKHAGVGNWNDPDMLEVGNDGLTYEENKSHFTLWCMMAAPLILGNDVRNFLKEDGTPDLDNRILAMLKSRELIAVDQDKLGKQCKRIRTDIVSDVLVKPLENDELAVCFFNKGKSDKEMSISLAELCNDTYSSLKSAQLYSVTELWDGVTDTIGESLSANVPSHGVKIFRIKAL